MKKTRINPLLLIGIIGILITGTSFSIHLYRAFGGQPNIWWTHQQMRLSIEESEKSFELFVREDLIQNLIEDGLLFLVSKDGNQHQISIDDLSVRLNNWYQVKSSIMVNAMLSGILLGMALAVFTIGLILSLTKKDKSSLPK